MYRTGLVNKTKTKSSHPGPISSGLRLSADITITTLFHFGRNKTAARGGGSVASFP